MMDLGKQDPDSLVGRIPVFSQTGTACAAKTDLEVGLLEVGLCTVGLRLSSCTSLISRSGLLMS